MKSKPDREFYFMSEDRRVKFLLRELDTHGERSFILFLEKEFSSLKFVHLAVFVSEIYVLYSSQPIYTHVNVNG